MPAACAISAKQLAVSTLPATLPLEEVCAVLKVARAAWTWEIAPNTGGVDTLYGVLGPWTLALARLPALDGGEGEWLWSIWQEGAREASIIDWPYAGCALEVVDTASEILDRAGVWEDAV